MNQGITSSILLFDFFTMKFLRFCFVLLFVAFQPMLSVQADYLGTSVPVDGVMTPNDWISSPSGNSFFYFQQDLNACIYMGTPSNNQGYIWCNMHYGTGDGFLLLTALGNLQHFHSDLVWNCQWTPTPGSGSNYYSVVIKEDSNNQNPRLAIYNSNTQTYKYCS